MKKLLLVLLALGFSPAVLAADGSSGCGAGWYILKKNSLLSSSLRTTTNALLFNATFGMTFGTSNCQKHDIVQLDKEDLYYAEANKEFLTIEMAEGRGEYVATFARTLGCDGAIVNEFGTYTRSRYEKIFSSPSLPAAEMLRNVKRELRANPELKARCTHA